MALAASCAAVVGSSSQAEAAPSKDGRINSVSRRTRVERRSAPSMMEMRTPYSVLKRKDVKHDINVSDAFGRVASKTRAEKQLLFGLTAINCLNHIVGLCCQMMDSLLCATCRRKCVRANHTFRNGLITGLSRPRETSHGHVTDVRVRCGHVPLQFNKK